MEKSKCCGYDGKLTMINETKFPIKIEGDRCPKCKTVLTMRIQEDKNEQRVQNT